MLADSVSETVVLLRKSVDPDQPTPTYYHDTDVWVQDLDEAKRLDEELAKGLANGLRLREPRFIYETLHV